MSGMLPTVEATHVEPTVTRAQLEERLSWMLTTNAIEPAPTHPDRLAEAIAAYVFR